MKTIEYNWPAGFPESRPKSGWPAGEWHDELDKKQWMCILANLPCLIVRNEMGAWCGYVGVGPEHPLFNLDYSESLEDGPSIECLLETPHGGITFSSFCIEEGPVEKRICHVVEDGENDRVWWFGFDCGHSDDFCPGIPTFGRSYEHRQAHGGVQYRTQAYVESIVEELALELKAIDTLAKYKYRLQTSG
jgi:hypothetical protein